MRRLIAFMTGLVLALPVAADRLHIATAANFKTTLGEIAAHFLSESGHQLVISSASTGVLYNQILHGAPFDIFLAADAKHPARLEQSGHATPGDRLTYAYGKLVLVYRESLASLAEQGPAALLASPGLDLVIANPNHAPYGRAAQAVLSAHRPAEDGRLLRAGNVGQAYQMWFSGGADAALVSKSSKPARFLDIPLDWYPAIEQQAVILDAARDKPAAKAFMRFLQSTAIRQVIEANGYGPGTPANG